MLKYVFATLQDNRTSFLSLIRRRAIKMVYAIRGPAAKQASLKCATNKMAGSVLYR